jgi:hypothetical protein
VLSGPTKSAGKPDIIKEVSPPVKSSVGQLLSSTDSEGGANPDRDRGYRMRRHPRYLRHDGECGQPTGECGHHRHGMPSCR